LGLFIAREIVLAHAGTIEATSSGEETEFTVEIPRHAQGKPQEAQPGHGMAIAAADA
jgi:signal transduction histidine kinase